MSATAITDYDSEGYYSASRQQLLLGISDQASAEVREVHDTVLAPILVRMNPNFGT